MTVILDSSDTDSGCSFLELQTEFYARGFDYFNQDTAGRTRAKRYLNNARAELDRMFLWPWREATISGTAPLAISDLGVIQSVTDSDNSFAQLARVPRQSLVEQFGDVTTVGTSSYYYLDWSSGSRTVAVYPVSTTTLEVRYWKVTTDMVADTDGPDCPHELCYLIVDLAVRRAYRDSDNHENAIAIQDEIDRQIDAALFQYQPGQADGPDSYVGVKYSSEDW